MIDEKLDRLIVALEARGYKKHGRATALKTQTGYAVSTISEVLKGKAELTERFTKIVCSAAGISYEWVWEEKGDMLVEERYYADNSGQGIGIGIGGGLPNLESMTLEQKLDWIGLGTKKKRIILEAEKLDEAEQDELIKRLAIENIEKGRY